jgi:hypothetical protein
MQDSEGKADRLGSVMILRDMTSVYTISSGLCSVVQYVGGV